ncbi:MAG: MFS transporter [Thermoplasmatota archaeon]
MQRLRSRAFRFVLVVGLLSLFADMAYEGAHAINGQYLGSLGAGAFAVGTVAGLGELAAYGLRFLSGVWADRTRAYWPITIFGYCVNLLAVPALALTSHWRAAAGLMLLERAGKAIRNPPRDAMFAHAAGSVGAGWAFGLHEAMDETGAALGPLVVAAVLWLRGGFHLAYTLLLLPALVSLSILLYARHINPSPRDLEPAGARVGTHGFGAPFWLLAAAGVCMAIGFADFSLIAYHADRRHILEAAVVPLVYAMANGVNAAGSLALGRAFDRWGPGVLAAAVVVPVLGAPLVFSSTTGLVVLGIVLWGVGVTVQQSLFKAMLSRLMPKDRRAFGFGTFDGLWGVASLGGGLLLGWLYDRGPSAAILGSVSFLALAALATWAAVAAQRTKPAKAGKAE